MNTTELIVEGEKADLLLDAIQTLMDNSYEDEDGMIHSAFAIRGDSGAALVHALGRVDAELHAADIRSYLPGGNRTRRTEEQRRADALIVLVERLAVAMELAAPPATIPSTGAMREAGTRRAG